VWHRGCSGSDRFSPARPSAAAVTVDGVASDFADLAAFVAWPRLVARRAGGLGGPVVAAASATSS
jgi:hypothetical protein